MKFQKPYLDVWIDVGFFQLKTSLFRERYELDAKEYVRVHITVFHRWGFNFNLYSPNGRN